MINCCKEDKKAEEEKKTNGGKKSASGAGKLSQLDQLKKLTTVVIDTGDYNLIKQFKPTDATTNPSLLLLACNMKEYDSLINEAIEYGIKNSKSKNPSADDADLITDIWDKLAVIFGTKILEIVPGYVSTEVDARLSFDTEETIKKAKKIIQMYKEFRIHLN